MLKQRTLKNDIRATGIGVHTGKEVIFTLKPAPINTGIVFRRVDSNPAVEIPAKVDFVGDTSFCTVLAKNEKRIGTVEHILSALAGIGVDNAIIELNGMEVPIMDGSSAPFVELIQSAGIEEQSAPKQFIKILKPIEVKHEDKIARLEPYNGFKLNFSIDFEHPAIRQGEQTVSFELTPERYIEYVAGARTFGFLKDVEWLRKNNLASGASLENTIVLDDKDVVNEEGLRYDNEFVRHKILDAIGDLYLLGYPLLAEFTGIKSGHKLNNLLNEAVLANPSAWEIVTL